MNEKSSLRIGKKVFLVSVIIIFVLMITAGVLTRILPAGSYDRVELDGRTAIKEGSYQRMDNPDYPMWRWFTAPFEVFGGSDNVALITICILIIFISGSFTILEKAGIIAYLLQAVIDRFQARKYLLMAVVIFIFMFMAAFLGVYEAMVPLIVFIVPLALSLGWDSLTGLGLSLLPMAFGFAAAVTNPFTIGVAQKIAELPLFSGAWYRIIFFAVVYGIVFLFVYLHARRVERDPQKSLSYKDDQELRRELHLNMPQSSGDTDAKRMRGAVIWFATCLIIAILFILVSSFLSGISDLAFPIMGLLFLVGGVGAGLKAGRKMRRLAQVFLEGTVAMIPGIVLIAMAYSVKHIIDKGGITDTILYEASTYISQAPTMAAAFLIYGLTLIMNFFIGSASAKAFLMMPILTPLADLVGITRQTAVLAFDFGDGFSNMLFPSNALLLIALGFTVISYPRWMRWTIKLQGIMLLVTALFLMIAVQMGFGPF